MKWNIPLTLLPIIKISGIIFEERLFFLDCVEQAFYTGSW